MQDQIIAAWKKLHKEKANTASSTLTYIMLRAGAKQEGFFEREMTAEEIDKISTEALFYIRRAFKPCTNKVKLANGRRSYDILERYDIRLAKRSQLYPAMFERQMINRLTPFGLTYSEPLGMNLYNLYASITKRIGL